MATNTMINPLESHAATQMSVATLGPCGRCGGEAHLRCNCGVLLCRECRPEHLAAAGAASDDHAGCSRPLGKLEAKLWKIPPCAGCGEAISSIREVWWRIDQCSEAMFCRQCAAMVAAQKSLPKPRPRPSDDTIIRGGCGHRDVTVGDLGEQATLSDVLIWIGLAAAIVGAIMLWVGLR
jgi:hypothetical protein